MDNILASVEQTLGYVFQNRDWLKRALTHSSSVDDKNYERLEFLGDRVLGLVMAHALFEHFPAESEGGLARRHSALVQGRTIALIGQQNGIGEYIIMSVAERASGGGEKENIVADVMEALFGAVYLDGGLDAARGVILRLWGNNIDTLTEAPMDPKTELQEWVQARGWPLPVYDIIDKTGPDHAPEFVIEVRVEGQVPIAASGPSRRQAEKTAARTMLRHLKEHAV